MKPEPMVFQPILKPRVWGGRELAQWGKHLPSGSEVAIGESWEIADLPEEVEEGLSVILTGPHAGLTLREAIERDREMIMGGAALNEDDDGFPLLIKLLDARQKLSVQVHPTAEYAAEHADAKMKSEAWIVLDAEPDAVIYKGLQPDLSREKLRAAIKAGVVDEVMERIPVQPGDCHYLPSGTCHALGSGIVVAEVQTPSDTTFRLFDWGRIGRDLHIEQALACIDFTNASAQAITPGEPIEVGDVRSTPLLKCDHFAIERQECVADNDAAELEVVTDNQPVIWIVTGGQGVLRWDGGAGSEMSLIPGLTILFPAAIDEVSALLDPGCSLLRIDLPSPTRNLIA